MRVVFVHGAFVRDGAWWWSPVASLLQAQGIASTAVLLPSCGEAGATPAATGPGLAEDAAALRSVLDKGAASIVVAHSYGGVVATQGAAGHPSLAHLVYVSSVLPSAGEALADFGRGDNPLALRPVESGAVQVVDDDHAAFDARFLHDVVDDDLVRGAHQRLTAQAPVVFGTAVTQVAWQSTPSTYVVCAEDRSTAPDLQREHAAHRATHTVEIAAAHHPMLSRPDLLAPVITAIARA